LIRAGEVAMRQALPEVRKWLETPTEVSGVAKARPAVVRTLPMAAD